MLYTFVQYTHNSSNILRNVSMCVRVNVCAYVKQTKKEKENNTLQLKYVAIKRRLYQKKRSKYLHSLSLSIHR